MFILQMNSVSFMAEMFTAGGLVALFYYFAFPKNLDFVITQRSIPHFLGRRSLSCLVLWFYVIVIVIY